MINLTSTYYKKVSLLLPKGMLYKKVGFKSTCVSGHNGLILLM